MKKRLFFHADRCMFCGSCELACSLEHSGGGDLIQIISGGGAGRSRISVAGDAMKVEARFCHSCEYPLCLETCIAGALELVDGRVVYDQAKCAACWSCVMGCPFSAVSKSPDKKAVLRCDGCGDWSDPACSRACPTGALVFRDPLAYPQARQRQFGRGAVNPAAARGRKAIPDEG